MSETGSQIVVYSSPFCGYCAAAKRLLNSKQVAFEEIDVMFDSAMRDEMVRRSGRTTVPQIFIDGRHIGGFDDIRALDLDGRLDALLEAVHSGAD